MSKLFIEDCQSLYSKCFPEDWIEKKKWDSQENANSSIVDCMSKIQEFIKNFFVCLSKSVLSGEYVISEKKVKDIRSYFQECAQKRTCLS